MRVSLAVEHVPPPTSVAGADPVSVGLVHGFTQNAACMRPFGEMLRSALERRGIGAAITLIDAPGHGASQHDRADLIDAARLCVEAGGQGHYVGYSMGGRMLLHGALLYPEAFASLTLIGATAGIDSGTDRAARLTADEQLAEQIESGGVAAFLDDWLALPMFAGLSDEAAGRQHRLANRAEGLAASLRHCGTGNQFPLWDRLTEIDVAVQVVVGSNDEKFSLLGERLVASLPNARLDSIDAGHAVHSEQPMATADAIAAFIAAVRSGER